MRADTISLCCQIAAQEEKLKKFAFLFPGQGSQKVGMGKDLYDALEEVKAIFRAAREASGLPVDQLCFEGPMEELTQTVNLQPAITVVNLACLAGIEKAGIRPAMCAGHSLGEYAALYAAGVVSAADCLRLVHKRGELMHREAIQYRGAMSAIMGLPIEQLEPIVAQVAAQGVVAVANHNSAEQIVITGEPEAVTATAEQAAALGARAVALKVSGAWHSPLIKGAEQDFRTFLESVDFKPPACPVIHNVTADGENDPARIRTLMARQLCSPVRWYDSMRRMAAGQIDVFVEIGPGRVLSGLLKKILPGGSAAGVYNVFDLKTLEKFLEAEG
jgi:[acyl-carrier-protein] S-malonyltransferase